MHRIKFEVRFNTPCFLGDSEQKGHWRTPAFKALLRQWWRIVRACYWLNNGVEADGLSRLIREEEGRLFGHAWLENDRKKWAMRSQIQIKLEKWKPGKLNTIPSVDEVKHPEVPRKINALLYMGFGPVDFRGPKLKKPPAIAAGETNNIYLGIPNSHLNEIKNTLLLTNLFGGLGGRSRNALGSVVLFNKEHHDSSQILLNLLDGITNKLKSFSRDFYKCMEIEWSHAIGTDNKGLLIWKTKQSYNRWEDALKDLAEIKIKLRTRFKFHKGGPHKYLYERHIISYPIKKDHKYQGWGLKKRLPNQIIFKIHKIDSGKFIGIAVHLPHTIPEILKKELTIQDKKRIQQLELDTWVKVHQILDQQMERLP